MGRKAKYGALMGLGQGISQYGEALTADALKSRSDNRFISRQHSLNEIEQRFKIEFRQEERLYQEGVRDDKNQRDEDKLTPGNPLYESRETQRQKLRGEKQADSLEQINAREKIYGGRGGIQGNLNQSQWTQDSYQAFMGEVNRLMDVDSDLSADEAYRIAAGSTPLVPKPPTAASDTASLNKSVREAVAQFMEHADSVKVEVLVGLGRPRESVETLTTLKLIEEFKQTIMGVMALPEQGGLMNQNIGGPPNLQTDPMGWLNSP